MLPISSFFFCFISIIRKRKANFDAAMAKLKEGNVGAATELFQVLTSSHFSASDN